MPNAANTAEVVRRLRRGAPEGSRSATQHDDFAIIAVQGTRSDEVLEGAGLPTGHDYMSLVDADFEGVAGDGLPHRLHRRARLRAGRPGAGCRRGLGRADGRRGAARHRCRAASASRDTLRTEMGYPLHGQDISP